MRRPVPGKQSTTIGHSDLIEGEPHYLTGQDAMLVWLEQFLVRYPELALFLVIAVGYWIGASKLGRSVSARSQALSSPACSWGSSPTCPS
jgi:hypothetical protein